MDEYTIEMGDLRRQIAKLKFERADLALIEELEAQLRILRAIYNATAELYAERTALLTSRLRERGLGDWTFDNVYCYVYDEAVGLEPGEHDLAFQIEAQDYRAHLEAPVQEGASSS
jgi:hypothetical protein